MARIRTIKPDFWKHEALSSLPEATHILAAALLNYADDDGYFNANPALIRAECTPLREPSVSIHASLISLSKIGFIRTGRGEDGRVYGHIINFTEHQRINRPTPSKIKALRIEWSVAVKAHTQLSEPSHPEGKGREYGNGMEVEGNGVARTLDTINRIQTRMEFDGEFWPLCPHQTGKTDAYAAFHEARQSASLSDICDGMRRYAETLKRPKAPQPMNPANWLQKQRWTDKPMEPTNATDSINPHTVRGAAAWVIAGELTRGAFEQPGEARSSYGGSYGGAVEAPYIDGTPYTDGSA